VPSRFAAPLSLERFWDEAAWQRRNLAEGDTLAPHPERRSRTVNRKMAAMINRGRARLT